MIKMLVLVEVRWSKGREAYGYGSVLQCGKGLDS
jgi:hypothetical protein